MRWQRLIEMSPQEIGYRLYKELAFRFDKWYSSRGSAEIYDQELIESFEIDWIEEQPELSFQSLRRYLCDILGQRFYFNPTKQDEIIRLVERCFPQWIERAREKADRVCQHRFQLLGLEEMHLGERIDWQRSPETGRQWPQQHWIDLDLLGPQSAGDPKIIWELNRHQQFLWLGLAYCYTGDESYVNEYLHQIESWIDQNPYQIGINWASSLEVAFRAINWFWALALFINSPRLHNSSIVKIMKSLVQHMDAISRNPSIYTSPNTHLIGEACALYMGGMLLREHRQGKRWRKFSSQVLKAELQRQILKDGAHKEQSAYYHCYTVEFFLLAEILARRNGEILDRSDDCSVLARACEYLMHICGPGGELPSFGDEDGGKVLMFDRATYRYPADLLSTAAAIFGRGDFKYFAGEFQESTLWLLGPEGLNYFDSLKAASPKKSSMSFNDSGHVVLRANWTAGANYLLFHSPHRTNLPGHTHADCLSFELASGGRGRIIDSGTYRYNESLAVRNYYRGTAAHNTVRLDGRDQSDPGDAFKWQRQASGQLLDTLFSPVADYVYAEHDGYMALPEPCLHRRAVLFARPDYFILWDEFTGSGEHYFESFFHFGNAEVEQTRSGSLSVSYRDGLRLLVFPVAESAISVDIVPTTEDGIGGWYSRKHASKEPCLSLRLHRRAAAPATMMTILFPYRDREPQIEICPPGPPNSLCARIATQEGEDIIICSLEGREFKQIFGRVNFKGEKLFLRSIGNVARGALAIGAQMIKYDGDSIFNSSTKRNVVINRETTKTQRAQRYE